MFYAVKNHCGCAFLAHEPPPCWSDSIWSCSSRIRSTKADATAGFRFWMPIAPTRGLTPNIGRPSFFGRSIWLRDAYRWVFIPAALRYRALPTRTSRAIAIRLFWSCSHWEWARSATHWHGWWVTEQLPSIFLEMVCLCFRWAAFNCHRIHDKFTMISCECLPSSWGVTCSFWFPCFLISLWQITSSLHMIIIYRNAHYGSPMRLDSTRAQHSP